MFKFKPKSFHLQWHITERCNLHCKHCYQDHLFLKNELKIEKLIKILEDFIIQIKKWKLQRENVRISFTGGEPLLRNDFLKLIQKCYENKNLFHYGILTNGVLLDVKMAKILKNLGVSYFQISLEGVEKTNDYIRGRGVFKKIIKTVNLLKKEGLRTNFSMTVSRANLKDVPRVVRLSQKLGIHLGVRRLVPSGRGKAMEKYLLTPLEVRELWDYVLKTQGVELGCEDGMLMQSFPNYRPQECSAGYVSFTILPNGDVYPCRRLSIYSGNLLKKSFETIYYNSKALQDLRNSHNINDVCCLCFYYEKCHGGAKCIAFNYFKDASSPDPQCWRLFRKLPDPKLKWRNSARERGEKLNSKWVETII